MAVKLNVAAFRLLLCFLFFYLLFVMLALISCGSNMMFPCLRIASTIMSACLD